MRGKDPPPPDEFRCKRTDGRQWRCKRRAMDGRTLCDIHFLQGQHRQHKQKVPASLKLERNAAKKSVIENGEGSRRASRPPPATRRAKCVSESLDEALRRMKLKRGDLHLELMRIFLQRQVEKKKERELKENAVEDETMELPYGVMAIAQSSPSSLQRIREGDFLDVKIGANSNSNGSFFLQRHFRSKNIEPLPIGTMQVVPFAENVKKMIKIKKCHWCRRSKCPSLIRAFEKQEVKAKCPACRGACVCQLCMKQKNRANHNSKDSCRGGKKLDRKQLLQYLIHTLLPVLRKINHDQAIELETESKFTVLLATGNEQAEMQITQSKLNIHASPCCNKCKASIVDYHRTCTSCSYNLCLNCCWEVSPHTVYGSFTLRSCKKRKISSSNDELPSEKNNITRQNWEAEENGKIPCPPTDIGGCGKNTLDLRCVFPFDWCRDLEVKAEEILCEYQFTENSNASPCCSLCNNGESKLHREFNRKIGISGNNYLYCRAVKDLHQEKLEHFQSHWVKGQPVIIRNVLSGGPTGLCWDPVNMLCLYLENKSSESRDDEDGSKGRKCVDWCEVEIERKQIFMGSLEKRTHAMVRKKVVKFKAWLSSHLFQKQFAEHYNEILSSLPFPVYINPISGLLNLGANLPNEFSMPDLGPCIDISYGGPEEFLQADYLSKLCYKSHDTVNILAYATDAKISREQINKIESLMKKYKKGKSPLQSEEDTGESGLQDNREKKVLPNGIGILPFYPHNVENGNNLSDDGEESDGEASILCCGSVENSEDSSDDIESSVFNKDNNRGDDVTCGAHWDIFPRQDVPKLLEYLRRHSKELGSASNYSKHVHHPILDQNFFLDAYHKLKLKEEFDVQPWSFEQYIGEAIFIPAGCPYQIRKIKSCVNVVLDFVSPENATQCIRLNDEIRLLPKRHQAKGKVMEVEKMALQGISSAIEDIQNLMHVDQLKMCTELSSHSFAFLHGMRHFSASPTKYVNEKSLHLLKRFGKETNLTDPTSTPNLHFHTQHHLAGKGNRRLDQTSLHAFSGEGGDNWRDLGAASGNAAAQRVTPSRNDKGNFHSVRFDFQGSVFGAVKILKNRKEFALNEAIMASMISETLPKFTAETLKLAAKQSERCRVIPVRLRRAIDKYLKEQQVEHMRRKVLSLSQSFNGIKEVNLLLPSSTSKELVEDPFKSMERSQRWKVKTAYGDIGLKYQEEQAVAYVAARMPAVYSALYRVLNEVRRRVPDFNPAKVLDFGAGTGSALWAIMEVWPGSLEHINLVEPSQSMQRAGQSLVKDIEKMPIIQSYDSIQSLTKHINKSGRRHDLVIASYVLGEISSLKDRITLVRQLWDLTDDILRTRKLQNAANKASKDLMTLKTGSFVVAPCPHDGPCPLQNTNKYCHFVQRLERTPSQRSYKWSKGPLRGFEDEKFSYVAFRRGTRPREPWPLDGMKFDTLKEVQAKRTPEDLEIDMDSQFDTEEEITATENDDDDNADQEPENGDSGDYNDNDDESSRADLGSGWGRIIYMPFRRGKRVEMDVCRATNDEGTQGSFDRVVVTQSKNPDLHHQARRSIWGDLWPLRSGKVSNFHL
ncbi:transcription factor jumonji (jmjC)domain-containing protein [Striga asiatica]|uniref:Transcription factor jumonji (JmjC)domain-containing protein n=1 Tax=Striga asiatica TaxID=4170 RepID=A0A5A7PG12_STRAF|nr:transcription factor jumonji (jmjC)domain-containing protein [Striga asiatica]